MCVCVFLLHPRIRGFFQFVVTECGHGASLEDRAHWKDMGAQNLNTGLDKLGSVDKIQHISAGLM